MTPFPELDLDLAFREYGDFVWRALHRLGVELRALDDATQDVFLVAHRRRADFDPQSAPRAWLYGIARRVAGKYRDQTRRLRPARSETSSESGPGELPETRGPRGDEAVALREAAQFVRAFIETLDPQQREVFILVEVEGMPVPEVSTLLDLNLNTAYSRLRLARARFKLAVSRHHARDAHAGRRSHGQAG